MGCFLMLIPGVGLLLVIAVSVVAGIGGLLSDFFHWAGRKFARPIGWWCRVVPEDVRVWMAVSLVFLAMVAASVLLTYGAVWLFGGKH